MPYVKYVRPDYTSIEFLIWVPEGQPAPDRMRSPTPVLYGSFTCRIGSFVHNGKDGDIGDIKHHPKIDTPTFTFRHEYPDVVRADLVIPAGTTTSATGTAVTPPISSLSEIREARTKIVEYMNTYPNDTSKDRDEFLLKQQSSGIYKYFQGVFNVTPVGEFSCHTPESRTVLGYDDTSRPKDMKDRSVNASPPVVPFPEIQNDRVEVLHPPPPPKPKHSFIPLKLLLTPPRVWTLEEMTWANESFWKCYVITIITDSILKTNGLDWFITGQDSLGYCIRQLFYLVSKRFFPYKTNKWCLEVFSADAMRRLAFGIHRFVDSLAFMRINNTREQELDCLMVLFRGFLNRCVSHV